MENSNEKIYGMPRLNEVAPAFEAPATHGVKKLEDYRGKWLVLFSHPADFTPVCTTEFVAFTRRHEDFQALNTELLGFSIDSHYSHVAWVRNIKEKFDMEVKFPIIADLSMDVARACGMIHLGAADTSVVRVTFIIDEFLRLITALQTFDEHAVVTPENWQLGDKVIVLPPATAEARMNEGYECMDWYFCKKSF